jgi:hypothetical protein
MADLLTDHGRPWAVDDQRLEEITLLTDVMIEATTRSGPLTQADIDALLVGTPGVSTPGPPDRDPVPRPRREAAMPAR